MASKYKRKSRASTLKPDYKKYEENLYGKKASTSRERLSQGQEIDLEAIERHERLTGINRAMWDKLLDEKIKELCHVT